MKKRFCCIMLSVLMVLGTLLPIFRISAETGRNISPNVNITKFTITNGEGKELNKISRWSRFKLNLDWNAEKYKNTLKKGDYFEVKLPDTFRFIEDSSAVDFPIYGTDGKTVYGKGKIAVKKEGGGVLRVTLNEKVENLYNVKGKISMESSFNQDKIKIGQDNLLEIEMNGKKLNKKIHIEKPGLVPDEILEKWPNRVNENANEVAWTVRFNVKGKNFKNVVFEDKLTVSNGKSSGLHYIKDSFELERVKLDKYGNATESISKEKIGNKVQISETGTKFRFELGDINKGEQYFLRYKSTYKPNLVVKNKVKLLAQGESHEATSTYRSAISNGSIEGNLLGKIKIIKVDADNNKMPLQGAKFQITNKETNETFELVTDEKGEAVSDKLVQGTYEIKEIEAPSGWIKSDEIINVEVKDNVAVVKTITNKREKTEVKVNKAWVGKKASSVVVNLLADGKKIDKVTLSDENNWQHTFKNLNKFKDDGKTEMKYTVEEEKIDGYKTEIRENAKNDFTITNKNIEKSEISVEKKWIGTPLKEVEVQLLANGKEVQRVKLNDSNSWKHTFKDLPKFDENDKEIVYTVKETEVEGYESKIEGNVKDGFVITNKKIPKNSKIPKTGVGTQILTYVTMGTLSLGLLQISRKKRNK